MTPPAWVAYAAKALLAGAIAGAGAMTTAAADGDVTQAEGWTVALSALVALGAVYGVPNGHRPRHAAKGGTP